MKKRRQTFQLLLLVLFGALPLYSASSLLIPFSGDLSSSGVSISSNVYMKMALMDPSGTTVQWTNDGTNEGGTVSEPTSAVEVTIEDGIFTVWLGDTTLTNMTALGKTVFSQGDVVMRVWLSEDNISFAALSPDKVMGAAPFSFESFDAEKLAGTTPGAAGLALLDDADAATARTTLGLGSASTNTSTDFATSLHGHSSGEIAGLGTASANAATDFAPFAHDHASGEISGLGTASANASTDFSASAHGHTSGDISGLGNMATQNTNSVSITGGSVTGITLEASSANLNGILFPVGDGTPGQVVVTDGSGQLSFAADTDTDTDTTLNLAGAETITGDWTNTANPWTDNEVADALTVNGGSVDGSPIGSTTPSTATFTALETTVSANINGLLMPTVDGTVGQILTTDGAGSLVFANASSGGGAGANLSANEVILADWSNSLNPWADNEVADALTISGGNIENTAIGTTTPSPGSFTTLKALGSSNLSGLLYPITDGTSGQVLVTNGAGNLFWVTISQVDGDSVASANIVDGSITTADIGNLSSLTVQDLISISGSWSVDSNNDAVQELTLAGNYLGISTSSPTYGIQLPNTSANLGIGLAYAWVTYSSGEFKENVEDIPEALDKVRQLRGVKYTSKAAHGKSSQIGFIAEEVAEVIPEVINRHEGRVTGMDYTRLTALNLQAIKELETENRKLKEQLKAMQQTLENINLRLQEGPQ